MLIHHCRRTPKAPHSANTHTHQNDLNAHTFFIIWIIFLLHICSEMLVCECCSNLTCKVSDSVCSWKYFFSSHWSRVYEDLHTLPQNKLITETREACVNIFYVIWKHGEQPYASPRDERRLEMRRKAGWGKNKRPLAFYFCANESHFVFSVSAPLLLPPVSESVCVCMRVLQLFLSPLLLLG